MRSLLSTCIFSLRIKKLHFFCYPLQDFNEGDAGNTFSLKKHKMLIFIIVSGETSPIAWQKTIRHYPGCWAELETENVILTVPADDVRNMDNPQILLAIWDRMMKAVAKLASVPAVFPRPERIVADVQISNGKY